MRRTGAVVRRLRILKAAFRAVDVAHSSPSTERPSPQDLAEPLDVRQLRLARAHLLAQAGDELGTQDVDAAVQHTAPEGDLVLLLLEVVRS